MTVDRPYTLIAELTYRCPLRCPYCSNPTAYAQPAALDTPTWLDIFRQAEALGVVQLHLTGGEPLLRNDLEELVVQARDLDLYTNLITSGIPLEPQRLARLIECGLSAVQLSFQGPEASSSDRIAGMPSFKRKLDVARWVKESTLPLTVNVVLHRQNIDEIAAIVALAENLGADRLELATAQYIGWALINRRALLPSKAQMEQARAAAREVKARLSGRMDILFVLPDYYSDIPKTCMDGWGRRYIVVTPDGLVLPCHAAHSIPGARPSHIAEQPLRQIWESSELFQRFRGEDWMRSVCRSCDRRAVDFAGCRCQAFALTGDPAATDPACALSSDHPIILQARVEARSIEPPPPFRYRELTQVP